MIFILPPPRLVFDKIRRVGYDAINEYPPPAETSACAFATHFARSRPYGGLQKTVSPRQLCASPSISFVKKRAHFAFSGVAQGSSVNANSLFNSSKNACGVAHSFVLLVNIAEFINFVSSLKGKGLRINPRNNRGRRRRMYGRATVWFRVSIRARRWGR